MTERRRDRGGIALIAVLLFLLLAGSTAATFVYRSLSDGLIAANREARARAEALARGGIAIALAVLSQDRIDEERAAFRVESRDDDWMRLATVPITTADGGLLHVRIEDAGDRLDLNAIFDGGTVRDPRTEVLLIALFERLAERMPDAFAGRDANELARNLIDWVDADDVGQRGEAEDDVYQRRDPPYRAANRPLLSLDELGLVEGFDPTLVDALRPYLSVQPWARADGINPNTAPPWILSLLFHGTGADFGFADEDTVRAVLDIREAGGILCADEADHPSCTPIREAVPGEIYPPPTFATDVFRVEARAEVGDVVATVEATVDRADPTHPAILSWRVD